MNFPLKELNDMLLPFPLLSKKILKNFWLTLCRLITCMMFWLISVHFNRPIIHFVQDRNTVDKKIS